MLQLLSQLRLLACKNGGLNFENEKKIPFFGPKFTKKF
jgi:hypothetical protein